MRQTNIFQLLDYVGAKYGEDAVKDIVLAVATVDAESSPEEFSSEEHDSVSENESELPTADVPKGTRLGKADLGTINRKIAAGEDVFLVRESDGERVQVIRVEGGTIFFGRAVSDGKGRSSDHRSRHSVLRDWRLVL